MSKRNPRDRQAFDPSRRRLLTGMAATGAAASLAGCSSSSSSNPSSLPSPQDSGIEHIVVAMMENRSFDHVLGWLPGANGQQAGLSFVDKNGNPQTTFHLASSSYGYQGCGFSDPDHSYDAGHGDYNGGLMDGFLKPQPVGDLFPIGYYTADDVPFFAQAAQNWTIFDAYHTGILSCTLPNRMYMHTGQTDRITNTLATSSLTTIWDRLIEAKVSCRYYYSDTPIIALWGSKYTKDNPISFKLSQFAKDFGKGGTPPAVSFVDPYMGLALGEALGTSWDDHAFADIRDGQCYLNYLYNVVRNSPVWAKTLLIINYDEWGGFFDHVPPPLGPVSPAESALGNDGRLGFRVPCIAIGPRARRGHIESSPQDPNSILNMICWRFGLDKLGVRGGSSGNMATALDFSSSTPDTSSVEFTPGIVSAYGGSGPFPTNAPFTHTPHPWTSGTFGGLCSKAAASSSEAWRQYEQHYAEVRGIQELGRQNGFDV